MFKKWLWLLGVWSFVWAGEPTSSVSLHDRLEALFLDPHVDGIYGVKVLDPQRQVVFEHHHDIGFLPASNQKLLTAYAALKGLGPDFRYRSHLWIERPPNKAGILQGSVAIQFSGDPSFKVHHLTQLLAHLSQQGITSIEKDVIIDDEVFDLHPYGPGWTVDSTPWYFSAPILGIILNENAVPIGLDIGALGQRIPLTPLNNALPLAPIEDHVIATTLAQAKHDCTLDVQVKRNAIQIKGCWPTEGFGQVIKVALDDPRALAQQVIQDTLKAQDIQLKGNIVFNPTPSSFSKLATHRSLPLTSLLKTMLQDSNNVYAESITKQLGKTLFGEGSYRSGAKAIETLLKQRFPEAMRHTRIKDGSGSSHYNLVSPELLTHILVDILEEPELKAIILPSLPQSGQSGTLRTRMTRPDLAHKVVAKTGNMTGVSALSGYLEKSPHHRYIFSLILNQSTAPYWEKKGFEQRFCQVLMEAAP